MNEYRIAIHIRMIIPFRSRKYAANWNREQQFSAPHSQAQRDPTKKLSYKHSISYAVARLRSDILTDRRPHTPISLYQNIAGHMPYMIFTSRQRQTTNKSTHSNKSFSCNKYQRNIMVQTADGQHFVSVGCLHRKKKYAAAKYSFLTSINCMLWLLLLRYTCIILYFVCDDWYVCVSQETGDWPQPFKWVVCPFNEHMLIIIVF